MSGRGNRSRMKHLKRLSVPPDYISYLIAIRDAKKVTAPNKGTSLDHKANVTTAMSTIEARYEVFNDAVALRQLEDLRQSPPMTAISESLRSCYDNNSKGIRNLKAAIAAAQGTRVLKYCPLCGTTLVATHDHYLPASLFPEFAVHPLNLVPCCSTCNSTKGDRWIDKDGRRLYIHAYSDLLPAEAFLHVELKTSNFATGVGAVFSVVRPTCFSEDAWSVIESHFCNLNLIDRYTDLSNDEIAEVLTDCGIYLNTGGKRVRDFLSLKAAERIQIFGISHWQVVLMNQLAQFQRLDELIARVRN